jgi:DNA gyrase subunit A
VTAIKLDMKDRVLGFALANKMREGLTVRTSRGGVQVIRMTRYDPTSRGGRGQAILQRVTLDAVIHDDARPVPPPEEISE